jgi:isopenicillin-N epimerase
MVMNMDDPTRAPDPSRRRFVRRLLAGSAGLAALPALSVRERGGLLAEPAPALPATVAVADEAYWRQVRSHFILRDGITPMNAANLCPAPRVVIDRMVEAMRDIDGDVSFQNRAKYEGTQEEVREKLARHLGASPDEIAIVRNTSEANNVIVGGLELGAGDEVVVFDQNHPTNNVAWDVRAARFGFSVRRVSVAPQPSGPDAVLDTFVDALTHRTRVVAFSDVSNVSGLRIPVRELCREARERGIHAHVDGAQSFGILRLDLHAMGCDSYASSAHKWLMGPKEAGVLYVRAERIPDLWPGQVGVGWGSGARTSARGARKLETLGQRSDATIAAFGAALDFQEQIGLERIETRALELARALKEGIMRIPGAELLSPLREDVSAAVVIARFEGRDSGDVYEALYRDHGIAAAPTGGVRFTPHVYNTMDDIERAVAAVEEVVARRG